MSSTAAARADFFEEPLALQPREQQQGFRLASFLLVAASD